MKIYTYEGKDIDKIKEKISTELNQQEDDIIIYEKEVKTGLFNRKKIEVNVILINDVIEYVKEYLKNIGQLMNIELNFEIKKRNKNIMFLLYSNQNNILIGKNGKTIDALQTIIKQALYNKTNIYINISLDVGNYKQNQINQLERLVNKIARDVAKTKVEVKLDSMNSNNRRIVHSTLADDKFVYTQSFGEEPNRYIIIKPKGK